MPIWYKDAEPSTTVNGELFSLDGIFLRRDVYNFLANKQTKGQIESKFIRLGGCNWTCGFEFSNDRMGRTLGYEENCEYFLYWFEDGKIKIWPEKRKKSEHLAFLYNFKDPILKINSDKNWLEYIRLTEYIYKINWDQLRKSKISLKKIVSN